MKKIRKKITIKSGSLFDKLFTLNYNNINMMQEESSVEENLFVKGSQQHLKQVADILLDNAAKYASPDSTVRVILRRQGSHCLLSVASAGDAISKEDLKNIFKRFYRMDKARSMNHSYGLGLSIADSIVGKHGGKIWATSKEKTGTTMYFVIRKYQEVPNE